MKALHRQSFILIKQTEAHIVIGLFLYRQEVKVRQGGKVENMKTQTFSSSFFSSLASAAAGAPTPAAGAAATAAPPDGTYTRLVSQVNP